MSNVDPVRRHRDLAPRDIRRSRQLSAERRLDLGFELFEMGRDLAGDLAERRKILGRLGR